MVPCIQCGDTPLTLTSKGGHRDCIQLLLDHKADPHHEGWVTGLGRGAHGGSKGVESDSNPLIAKTTIAFRTMFSVRVGVTRVCDEH